MRKALMREPMVLISAIAHRPIAAVGASASADADGLLTNENRPANNPGMTKDEAVAWFGTQAKLADALGMTQGSVSLWGEQPPPLRQLQIESHTAGALKAGVECDKYRVFATP